MVALDCQRVFQKSLILNFFICFHIVSSDVFVVLYNRSLNDWFLGKQLILFPSGPVIKVFNVFYRYIH